MGDDAGDLAAGDRGQHWRLFGCRVNSGDLAAGNRSDLEAGVWGWRLRLRSKGLTTTLRLETKDDTGDLATGYWRLHSLGVETTLETRQRW